MRTVIFSDTHLSDKFDPAQFRFLSDLISSYERVVINGDFWDGYLINFDQFLRSEWSRLFPLLKERETIYIFGNHDREEWQDDRNLSFANQVLHDYQIDGLEGGQDLHIEHGNRLVSHLGDNITSHKNVLKLFLPYYRTRIYAEDLLGQSIKWKKDYINQTLVGKSDGGKMIRHSQENLPEQTILVASHIHAPIFLPEQGYINTGIINSHLASYLTIDEGQMSLVKDIY